MKHFCKDEILECIEEFTKTVRNTPVFSSFKCSGCGSEVGYYFLDVYKSCPNCDKRYKVRGFGPRGDDKEDIIIDILEWCGIDPYEEE